MLFIVSHKMKVHNSVTPRIIHQISSRTNRIFAWRCKADATDDNTYATRFCVAQQKQCHLVSDITSMRDMLLLVCAFLAVQRHVLSHDGADLRIHVTP